jgi:hypothetical protein
MQEEKIITIERVILMEKKLTSLDQNIKFIKEILPENMRQIKESILEIKISIPRCEKDIIRTEFNEKINGIEKIIGLVRIIVFGIALTTVGTILTAAINSIINQK